MAEAEWTPEGGISAEEESRWAELGAHYHGALAQHVATLAPLPLSDDERRVISAVMDEARALLDDEWPRQDAAGNLVIDGVMLDLAERVARVELGRFRGRKATGKSVAVLIGPWCQRLVTKHMVAMMVPGELPAHTAVVCGGPSGVGSVSGEPYSGGTRRRLGS